MNSCVEGRARMTNDEIIQSLIELRDNGQCVSQTVVLNSAIKNLEALDKIREEIKNYDNFILCANGQKGIHIDKALEIIDKHLSEVNK